MQYRVETRMIGTPTNVNDIREGIVKHGASSSACATLLAETEAANESIASGLYVTWSPHPSSTLGPSAADELRSGAGQCCRVGSTSVCMCGHSLENHKPVVPSKSGGYTKPPTCLKCKRCTGYQYVPSRPEECGQWWLSRRGDFNLLDWRKRIREQPDNYACIGCELRVSEHETVFESRKGRINRGAKVDEHYIPLAREPVAADGAEPIEQSDMDTIRERAFAGKPSASLNRLRKHASGAAVESKVGKK